MIFLGNFRATFAVFFSIPLSALAAFIALAFGDDSINGMMLGGLALAFSRLIDDSVVVLENIFRHIELGESREVAAEKGGRQVAVPVLASTLTTAVVFFPVTFLYGVSEFLFSALALAVVLSLLASYALAMSVVPLFCAKFISHLHATHDAQPACQAVDGPEASSRSVARRRTRRGPLERFNPWFNPKFQAFLDLFDRVVSLVPYAPRHRPRRPQRSLRR